MGTLKVRAYMANTGAVLDFVTDLLNAHNIPEHLHSDILVAVEEVFVNIAHYAYPPEKKGNVDIHATVENGVCIRIKDSGKPFNPLEQKAPDLSVPLSEREIGGLGLHFVKNLMDDVLYEYADGKNIITLIKNVDKGV